MLLWYSDNFSRSHILHVNEKGQKRQFRPAQSRKLTQNLDIHQIIPTWSFETASQPPIQVPNTHSTSAAPDLWSPLQQKIFDLPAGLPFGFQRSWYGSKMAPWRRPTWDVFTGPVIIIKSGCPWRDVFTVPLLTCINLLKATQPGCPGRAKHDFDEVPRPR